MFPFLPTIIPSIGSILSGFSQALKVVGDVFYAGAQALNTFCNVLGLTTTPKVEDLGVKHIQATEEGIVPENYNDFQEYLDDLEAFEIDEVKASEISKEEKYVHGAAVAAKALSEKFPDQDVSGMIESVIKNPEYYNDERFKELSVLAGDDPKYIDALAKAFSDEELEEEEYYNVMDMITSLEEAAYPDLSPEEISERVRDIMG